MEVLELVLGIILLVLAAVLVVLVLAQEGKDKKLSGSIAGGSDTFFGKTKTASKDKILSVATTSAAVAFVVIVLSMYLML